MNDDGDPNGSYREDDLLVRLRQALEAIGADPECLTREDLTAIEEFHLGGRQATRELADLAGLEPGNCVLDVGCGIGGPARTLAAEYDCDVLGLDCLKAYPRAARWLSTGVSLADHVEFIVGDASTFPVADAAFDTAWLQHAGMNVPEKDRLFAELFRAVRPGGTLAIHEVCAGPGGSPRFPVPWASNAAESYLLAPDELARVATNAGFERLSWEDVTNESLAQVQAAIAARDRGDVGTSVVDLLVDADADAVFENLAASLESDRISVVMGVFWRPTDAD